MNTNNQDSLLTEDDIQRKFAARITLIVSVILLLAKFWAFNLTGSQAVLSDALESIVNVVAASLLLFVIYYASKPADTDHPYGHGKTEYFSAAFEGGLIIFAGLMITIEGVRTLILGHELKELSQGIYIVVGAGIINLLLGLFLISEGKKRKSEALKGSGIHVISDFWTSVGVVVGLIIVHFTGLVWIDSVVAIVVGVLLLATGFKLVKKSAGALLDEENIDDLKKLRDVLDKLALKYHIIQVHHLKLIRSGRYHHIDAHLVLPEFWTVRDIHENIGKLEKDILKYYGHQGELNTHIDPCRRVYCSVCDVSDCKIRVEPFKERMGIQLEHLRSMNEPEEYK
jgi:cation diffusion facilitator family transporter